MIDVRQWVIDQIKPTLPKSWVFIPHTASPDGFEKTTVILWLDELTRAAQAPAVSRLATYTLTVIQPKKEPGAADDALDNDLIAVLDALDNAKQIVWTRAERAVWAEQYPSYQITLTSLINKE